MIGATMSGKVYKKCDSCEKRVDNNENYCDDCREKEEAVNTIVDEKFEEWYNGSMTPYTMVSEWFLLDLALFNDHEDLHQHREKMVGWLKAAFKEGFKCQDKIVS